MIIINLIVICFFSTHLLFCTSARSIYQIVILSFVLIFFCLSHHLFCFCFVGFSIVTAFSLLARIFTCFFGSILCIIRNVFCSIPRSSSLISNNHTTSPPYLPHFHCSHSHYILSGYFTNFNFHAQAPFSSPSTPSYSSSHEA